MCLANFRDGHCIYPSNKKYRMLYKKNFKYSCCAISLEYYRWYIEWIMQSHPKWRANIINAMNPLVYGFKRIFITFFNKNKWTKSFLVAFDCRYIHNWLKIDSYLSATMSIQFLWMSMRFIQSRSHSMI